jgi:hypothetical protein
MDLIHASGAEDGLGAEVLCSPKPPDCPQLDGTARDPATGHLLHCAAGCPNNTNSGLNETCGNGWELRLVNYTCEHEVSHQAAVADSDDDDDCLPGTFLWLGYAPFRSTRTKC